MSTGIESIFSVSDLQRKNEERLNRANNEELLRHFSNLTKEEQSVIATKMESEVMENELKYRKETDKMALDSFMKMAEVYREVRR